MADARRQTGLSLASARLHLYVEPTLWQPPEPSTSVLILLLRPIAHWKSLTKLSALAIQGMRMERVSLGLGEQAG